jgi:uncharacterized protein (DUF58 family)
MLSADEARQLDGLTFGAITALPSVAASGVRVARVRGFGGEFEGFRQYQPGDDPRFIDWTIYGRLGQLVTRTSHAHARLRVHLLVDTSQSMSLGLPDKLSCAKKVAAVLAYVASRDRDAVGTATFADRIVQRVEPSVGRSQLFRVFAALGEATPAGRSAIGPSLIDYGAAEAGPGLVVVISDFFDPTDVFRGLRYLRHRGLTPAVAQVVSPDELDPPLENGAELVDVEAPEAGSLVVDAASVAAYRATMVEHRAALAAFCATHGLPWLQLVSSASFDRILTTCHGAGLLAG